MDSISKIKNNIKILDYIEATANVHAINQVYNNYYFNKCPICNGYKSIRKSYVNVKSKIFNCPTCNNKGDIITYHMKKYKKSFKEAISDLLRYV